MRGEPVLVAGAGRFSPRALALVAAVLVTSAVALGLGVGRAVGAGSAGGAARSTAAFGAAATGIAGRRPAGWVVEQRGGGLALVSPDRAVAIEVAAPAPSPKAGVVLADSVGAIGGAYRDVRVVSRLDRPVDHLAATTVVLTGRTTAGSGLRISVSVASGHRLSYLLEVFARAGVPAATLGEAQAVVDSLRLTG